MLKRLPQMLLISISFAQTAYRAGMFSINLSSAIPIASETSGATWKPKLPVWERPVVCACQTTFAFRRSIIALGEFFVGARNGFSTRLL